MHPEVLALEDGAQALQAPDQKLKRAAHWNPCCAMCLIGMRVQPYISISYLSLLASTVGFSGGVEVGAGSPTGAESAGDVPSSAESSPSLAQMDPRDKVRACNNLCLSRAAACSSAAAWAFFSSSEAAALAAETTKASTDVPTDSKGNVSVASVPEPGWQS